MAGPRCEYELLTFILAPTTPTSLRLRMTKCPSRKKRLKDFDFREAKKDRKILSIFARCNIPYRIQSRNANICCYSDYTIVTKLQAGQVWHSRS